MNNSDLINFFAIQFPYLGDSRGRAIDLMRNGEVRAFQKAEIEYSAPSSLLSRLLGKSNSNTFREQVYVCGLINDTSAFWKSNTTITSLGFFRREQDTGRKKVIIGVEVIPVKRINSYKVLEERVEVYQGDKK